MNDDNLTLLNTLKNGNLRFLNSNMLSHDHHSRIQATKHKQTPKAVVVACMDSRCIPEYIFDQGIGDIFTIRLAGHVLTPAVIESIEYATAVVGSTLVVILGHTGCGAVTASLSPPTDGQFATLIKGIAPAAHTAKQTHQANDDDTINLAVIEHTRNTKNKLCTQSKIIKEQLKNKKMDIVTAQYDVKTGSVHFFDV